MSAAARVSSIVVAVLSVAATAVAQVPFEVVLWVERAADRPDAFWAGLTDLGFSAVSLSAGDDAAVPAAHGLRFYRDQLAGKGILELRDSDWQPILDRFLADRDPASLRRPAELTDPATRARLVGAIEDAMRALGDHRPFAASLADEASATRHANPLDLCASEAFRAGFRDFLIARYGSIRRLNEAWGTGIVGFDSVEPWTTDRIRARELTGASLPRNLAPWSDQLDYTDKAFADMVVAGLETVARIAPDLPCGLTGMPPPSAFGGHDYARLLPGMSFYEVYDIGGSRDLAGALARPGALEFATLFPPAAGAPPGIVEAQLGSLVAHGLSGVVVWSASNAFDAEGKPNRYARDLASAMRTFGAAASRFSGARMVRDPVWIVESQPSVRAHWMLDSWDDAATWPKRFSSHEAEHGTPIHARRSWIALLTDLGLQPDFVLAADLPVRLASAPPKLLVLPACLAISDAAVAAISTYVESGGQAIADHGLAVYDESLRLRAKPALDSLFGLRGRSSLRGAHLVRNARGDDRARLASGVAVAERGVLGALGQPVDGDLGMVQVEARPGRGRTTFLNLAVAEYDVARLEPERVAMARDLRRRVQQALDAAEVVPAVMVRGEGLPTCLERIRLAGRNGAALLAIRLDALESIELCRALGERGPRPITVTFPHEVALRDLVAGAELGRASTFTIDLAPWRPILLEVRR